MDMGRISVAFSPLSDVVAFSYRDGMTHLQALSVLRKAHNELVAHYNNLVQHVVTAESTLKDAFDTYVADTVIPQEEYEALTATLTILKNELSVFSTTDTDYTEGM